VLETTRIRREGYAVRMPHAEFVERYRLVAHRPSLPPSEANCRLILNKSKLTDWHIGKTKVFIKYWHTERLTQMLEEVQKSVLKMQKVVRGFLCRRRFKRMIHAYRAQQREVAALMKKARELQIDLKQVEDVKQKRNLGQYFLSLILTVMLMRCVNDGAKDDDVSTLYEPRICSTSSNNIIAVFVQKGRNDELLGPKPVGCFLVRVSESRFGYTLSYRAETRCKHYMIDQTRSGKYIIVGMPKVYKTLNDLVIYHKTVSNTPVNPEGDLLLVACGQ
ncbi:predicted protein, partial [Nematostella vectensis]